MRTRILNDPYRIINIIFIGIIIAVIAYSFFFGSNGRVHPIPSGSGLFTDKESLGTGLSRSFSAIVHLNFTQAKAYNPHGLRIFLFFFIQLVLRAVFLFIPGTVNLKWRRYIVIMDIAVSLALFTGLFLPFITGLFARVLTC